MVARRARREPVAYIIGRREFWGLELEVTRDVLVPRPETELVVEEALALDGLRRLIDAGTGSGCLAVALARARGSLEVVAVDRSRPALAVARRNAARHGVGDRIRFVQSCWLGGLRGGFDAIVANPPYVPTTERHALPPEVRQYEPAGALFAGPDGLDAIRALLLEGAALVRPGGWLVCEFGAGQHNALRELVAGGPAWTLERLHADLRGHLRVAVCRRCAGG